MGFPMHKQHHKLYHHPNSELGPLQHSRLPVHTHLRNTTESVRELPLLAPQLPQAKVKH
jgi:hypothetical protein